MSIVVVVVVVEDAGVDSHGSSVSMLMGNGTVVGHHDSGPDISQLLCGGHGSMVCISLSFEGCCLDMDVR